MFCEYKTDYNYYLRFKRFNNKNTCYAKNVKYISEHWFCM